MKKGVAIIAVFFLIVFLSVGLVSASWFSDIWAKITGYDIYNVANGDCVNVLYDTLTARESWNGNNNAVGVKRSISPTITSWPDKFLCSNTKFYACNWINFDGSAISNYAATNVAIGNQIGNWRCTSTRGWVSAGNNDCREIYYNQSDRSSRGEYWDGTNNLTGVIRRYPNGTAFGLNVWSTVFMCYEGRFYGCNWSVTGNSAATNVAVGDVRGSWQCSSSGWSTYVAPTPVPTCTKCMNNLTLNNAPKYGNVIASYNYNSPTGTISLDTQNHANNLGYEFWWTYYYRDGSSKDFCGCNGTTLGSNGKVFYTGLLPLVDGNNYYALPFKIDDSNDKTLDRVEIKTAVFNGSARSNWVSHNVIITYDCTNDCNILGKKSPVLRYMDQYQTCITKSGDSCLHLSSPINCLYQGYAFNESSQSCYLAGTNNCTSPGMFCNSLNTIINADKLLSYSCGVSDYSCFKCSSGFTFNSTYSRCINNSCRVTCPGVLSDSDQIDNAFINNSFKTCGIYSNCYVCGSGYHAFNNTCVLNDCSGSLPETKGDNNTLIGLNASSTGASAVLVWNYTSSQTPGVCQWTCNISKPSHEVINDTFRGCVAGVGPCSGICSNVSINNGYSVISNCTPVGDVCYLCNAGYERNGSSNTCVCPVGKTSVNNQCVDSNSVGKCLYEGAGGVQKYISPGVRIGLTYCASNLSILNQKNDGETCSEKYECKNNYCGSGKCVDLAGQQTKQTEYLSQIWCYLKRFFGGTC